MEKERFKLKTREKKKVSVDVYHPEGEPLAALQVLHGMAETKDRYEDFAQTLAGRGIVVYVYDHRGHGKSKIDSLPLGLASVHHSWKTMRDDVLQVTGLIEARHPGIPLFLLGHSMGSLLARDFAGKEGTHLAGLILSGTAANPGLKGLLGQWLSGFLVLVQGSTKISPLLDRLLFGRANDFLEKPRTRFDWLTRDETLVDKYIQDPLCGYICPAGFYHELIKGTRRAWRKEAFARTPGDLPIYVFGGGKDPIGNFGQAVVDTAERYRSAGVRDVVQKVYPEGRHEMLNELNRQDVYRDVAIWMEEKMRNWKG